MEVELPLPDFSHLTHVTPNNTVLTWDSMSDFHKESYLQHHMMEEEWGQTLGFDIGCTVFYIVLWVIGVPSNLMTLYVLFYGGETQTKSPTSYFLINLTIVDLFSLACSKNI